MCKYENRHIIILAPLKRLLLGSTLQHLSRWLEGISILKWYTRVAQWERFQVVDRRLIAGKSRRRRTLPFS